jgi:hypothetical protein
MSEQQAAKLPAFFRTINPDESAPVVDREALKAGAIVRYIGARDTENRTTGRRSKIHTFYSEGGEGVAFAVWGSVELDSQLRKLRGGTGVVFLRYNGKVPHPTMPDRTVHKWTVSEAVNARLEHIRSAREPYKEAEETLNGVIAAAAEADRQRMLAQGGPGGPGYEDVPPPPDDDTPF